MKGQTEDFLRKNLKYTKEVKASYGEKRMAKAKQKEEEHENVQSRWLNENGGGKKSDQWLIQEGQNNAVAVLSKFLWKDSKERN